MVPEAHSLHCIEVVEPELVPLTIGEQLAPHFLQVVENAVVLLASPGRSLDGVELERIRTVLILVGLRLGYLVHDAEIEEVFFHLLLDRSLDLRNQQGHKVGVRLLA